MYQWWIYMEPMKHSTIPIRAYMLTFQSDEMGGFPHLAIYQMVKYSDASVNIFPDFHVWMHALIHSPRLFLTYSQKQSQLA